VKPTRFRSAVLPVVLALSAAGCTKPSAPAASTASASGQTAPAVPAAQTAVPAGGQAVETVSGEVVETMNASTYTYLRVKHDKGEIWAATGTTPLKVGDKVTVPLESPMQDFRSPSLDRTFPLIYFVTQIGRDGQQLPPQMAVAHGEGMGMGGGASSPAPTVVKAMAPPAGGSSIADVWAKRAALVGKTVTINGTVVKFNGGILGRNWLHVQDGSGRASEGTNDITVTTDAPAKLGDVVTVTGKVAIDKDFGAGYAYKVMIEEAKVK
jgi:hypothetical protein